MKVAHKNTAAKAPVTGGDEDYNIMVAAREQEAAGEMEKAIDLYQQALKKYPRQANIYDRLMILHRKEKAYKKELSVINAAIKEFGNLFQPGKNLRSKKVASLSKSILHSTGLADKKGRPLYHPQPIARWQKRKRTVQHKLGVD
jgi:tetratricopeptide (TPR) repeat protein